MTEASDRGEFIKSMDMMSFSREQQQKSFMDTPFSIVNTFQRNASMNSALNPISNLPKTQFLKEYNFLKKFYFEHQEQVEHQQKSPHQLDIGFLFASPLIYKNFDPCRTRKEGMEAPPPISFQEEVKNIKQAIRDSEKKIAFKSMVATISNFSEMLNKEPRILHISCHGIQNQERTMGVNYMEVKDEGNFLLLESQTGEGELVSSRRLHKLITSTLPNLDLVFVAACDSEFVGKIF